jgi:hypothetical protein
MLLICSVYSRAHPKITLFNSWMAQLPLFLSSTNTPIGESIIAAAMAHCAREYKNPSMMLAAFKHYGSGISRQRKAIERITKSKREPTIEELYTPIILAFFEGACRTSQTGYFQHLIGAAQLMKLQGPQDFKSGVTFELFQALRIQLVSFHIPLSSVWANSHRSTLCL